MPELERLMLHRLSELDELVRQGYDAFEFKRVTRALLDFMGITATNAIDVAGWVFPTYSANIIANRNSVAGVYLWQKSGVGLQTDSLPVYLIGQTAAIAATTLLGSGLARKGMYRFFGYLAPTVVGTAGNLTLNAIFTDDSGTTQTLPVCQINNTALAGVGGELKIECNGASLIGFSVTGYTSGLTYTVRVAVSLDSWGSL